MADTIFERMTRRARRRRTERHHQQIVVVYGAKSFRAAAGLASIDRLRHADLVIGVCDEGGYVLKDRAGQQYALRADDFCPCRSGRRFATCHGR